MQRTSSRRRRHCCRLCRGHGQCHRVFDALLQAWGPRKCTASRLTNMRLGLAAVKALPFGGRHRPQVRRRRGVADAAAPPDSDWLRAQRRCGGTRDTFCTTGHAQKTPDATFAPPQTLHAADSRCGLRSQRLALFIARNTDACEFRNSTFRDNSLRGNL